MKKKNKLKKAIGMVPFLTVCALVLLTALPAMACWAQPEAFEVLSEDGSRVFVFVPDEDGISDATATVYEVVDGERQVLYTVEGLSSFAYKSNFHFSADLTHFARTFNPTGMPAFEVFSNGVRTRTVVRSDFIDDYDGEEALTSIGPMYTIRWEIEAGAPQGDVLTIGTDEGNTLHFDLATARFSTEPDLTVQAKGSDNAPRVEGLSGTPLTQPPGAQPPAQAPQKRPPYLGIALMVGTVALLAGLGAWFYTRHRSAQ